MKLIEDAAHAFLTRYHGRPIGSFGDATCFSFYANKNITTGEGGMLVTDKEDIYKRAKVMRLHGINRDVWDRHTAVKANWEYDVVAPGFIQRTIPMPSDTTGAGWSLCRCTPACRRTSWITFVGPSTIS